MDAVEKLLAIEEIKTLKAKYFRYVDAKNWEEFFSLFTADATFAFTQLREQPYSLREARDMIPAALRAGVVSVHHGMLPEIDVLSLSTAKGIWSMEDRIFSTSDKGGSASTRLVHGLGHYHETYRCEDGRWLIETVKLTRLWRSEHTALAGA